MELESLTFEEIVRFAKEYGLFYPTAEIYGGISGFYDYGSLGTLLKRRFEEIWKSYFLNLHDNFWEIEGCNILPEKVFQASGHLFNFNDPITECKKCKHRFRADTLIEEKLNISAEGKDLKELTNLIRDNNIRCPICDSELSEVKWFNLMFPIFIGPEIGSFFAEIDYISNYIKKLKEIRGYIEKIKKKPKYIIEGGEELITFLYEAFKKTENLILYTDEDYNFYIINKKTLEGVYIDIFERKAIIYGTNADLLINRYLDKYKNIDVETYFEKFLNKIPEQFHAKYINLENLAEYYFTILKNRSFLRPETAQSTYINFKLEYKINRERLPLGLAIIGKAFRNEISPRQALIRMREFTQAELQIFFEPESFENNFKNIFPESQIYIESRDIKVPVKTYNSEKIEELSFKDLKKYFPEWYIYFIFKVYEFYTNILDIPKDKIRFRVLSDDEKAFYNKYHVDIEFYFESLKSWKEIGGIHYRTDHDLKGHQTLSGVNMSLKKENKQIIPHVLELSFGVDRNIFAIIDVFLKKDKKNNRLLFKIPIKLAPIQIAVLPLVSNKEDIVKKAREVYNKIRKYKYKVVYDESGSIGKRYRRQDLRGTPYCITIDYQTLEDNTVTIRDRDTMKQERIKIEDLDKYLNELFN